MLRWNVKHAVLMLLSLTAVIAGLPVWVLIASAWMSLLWYLYQFRSVWSGSRFFIGAANGVTLVRLAILSIVIALYPSPSTVVCGWLLIFILCLDGVDGFLARLYSESSVVGQHLDVEVDAFAIAVMSIVLWHELGLSLLFVLAGALRYFYVLIMKFLIRVERTEPKRQYASLIAVLVYVAMVLELAFHQTLTFVLLVLGVVLLTGSFTRSFVFQWNGRHQRIID